MIWIALNQPIDRALRESAFGMFASKMSEEELDELLRPMTAEEADAFVSGHSRITGNHRANYVGVVGFRAFDWETFANPVFEAADHLFDAKSERSETKGAFGAGIAGRTPAVGHDQRIL